MNQFFSAQTTTSERVSGKRGFSTIDPQGNRKSGASVAFNPFQIKPLVANLSIALGLSLCALPFASNASPVFDTINTSSSIHVMSLTQMQLGYSVLETPTQLQPGPNDFKYVAVMFRPSETGTYVFGQTNSPTDTVMIIYDGGFDPTAPGVGALKGNDDTLESTHRNTLGADAPAIISCGNNTNWCPQVSIQAEAGKVYTLLISLYYGPRDNGLFDVPISFYSNRDGEFRNLSQLSPIDTSQANLASDLDFKVKREFKGGVLSMNLANGTYALSFTAHNAADFAPGESNRIDQNGNVSTFSGVIRDCDASCGTFAPGGGALTIMNSGSGGKVVFSGDNTYSGGSRIESGATLSISKDGNLGSGSGTLALAGGTLENTAQMVSNRDVTLASGGGTFNTVADLTLGGQLSSTGNGGLTKAGAASLTLTNENNVVDHVSVEQGVLHLGQSGTFTVTTDYTTASGAQTTLGVAETYLDVGNTFKQDVDSTLSITLNNSGQADITAKRASLRGTLSIEGFSDIAPPPKASIISNSAYRHVILHTEEGISGDFDNSQLGSQGAEYLLHRGYISADTKDYELGFKLAWIDGDKTNGTGSFTLNAGSVFEVDLALANRLPPAGDFDSGWNGKDLIKEGEGELILSAINTYSGSTTINAGTLSLAGNGDISSSSQVNMTGNARLDLSGINTSATLQNLSGVIDNTIDLGNKTLSVTNSRDTFYAGTFSGTGKLVKEGGQTLTLSGVGSAVGSVEVQGGTLRFTQDNGNPATPTPFSVAGDYTTRSGATTHLGTNNSVLDIDGAFIQETGSHLEVELGAWINGGRADIQADGATLNGTLRITGFTAGDNPNSSNVLTTLGYKLLESTSGPITGYYSGSNLIGAGTTGLDYLSISSTLQANSQGQDRELWLGFLLNWTDGRQSAGTGNFTVDTGRFTVDNLLSDQTGSFDSNWDGKTLTKKGAGTLRLAVENTYTGKTIVDEGMLQAFDGINNVFARSSDILVNAGGVLDLNGTQQTARRLSNDASGGGHITLNGGVLTADNSTGDSRFSGQISDGVQGSGGSVIKSGAGSLTLSGQTLWSGETRLEGGTLVLDGSQGGARLVSNIIGQNGTQLTLKAGASLTGTIDPTNVSIDSASRWTMTGNSDVDTLTLAGRIEVVAPPQPMNAGRTLKAHNWVGQGGTITLHTRLEADNSVTDQIVIDGGQATGHTGLDIRNAGGLGAQTQGDGIKIVDAINGSTTTADAFALKGRVAAGAYEYHLFRQDVLGLGDNWYLRSTAKEERPEYRNEVPVNLALLGIANRLGLDMLGTYHERTGSAAAGSAGNMTEQTGTVGWGRIFGRTGDTKYGAGSDRERYRNFKEHGPSYELDSSGFQVGADLLRQKDGEGREDKAGVYISMAQADARVEQVYGSRAGHVDMTGYGVGAYWTHLSPQGWYTDTVVQATYYGEAESRSRGGEKLDSGGWGMLASVEGGYAFPMSNGWNLEPQAQLIYQRVNLDDGRDQYGRTDLDTTHAVYGRVGARLSKRLELENGRQVDTWVRANLWNTFGSDGKARFSDREGNNGTTLSSSLGGRWSQVGVGISGEVSKRTTLFAGADYEHALGDGKGDSIGGRVGVNILW